MGFAPEDVRDVLATLTPRDSVGRLISRSTGEWLYVFKLEVGGDVIYVKLVLRASCIVVSFHEDEGTDDQDEDS